MGFIVCVFAERPGKVIPLERFCHVRLSSYPPYPTQYRAPTGQRLPRLYGHTSKPASIRGSSLDQSHPAPSGDWPPDLFKGCNLARTDTSLGQRRVCRSFPMRNPGTETKYHYKCIRPTRRLTPPSYFCNDGTVATQSVERLHSCQIDVIRSSALDTGDLRSIDPRWLLGTHVPNQGRRIISLWQQRVRPRLRSADDAGSYGCAPR
jgi:hypothetical protein